MVCLCVGEERLIVRVELFRAEENIRAEEASRVG